MEMNGNPQHHPLISILLIIGGVSLELMSNSIGTLDAVYVWGFRALTMVSILLSIVINVKTFHEKFINKKKKQ